ncbi:hypothetical protein K7T73_12750 [Bacillus badius]|uniref:hypothetical protein n=1 Tax=Bacillus badius TaxID=1455 RepID=UPI001CBD4565|nr:hypothetical protein [Bacillus badius]UAT29469.1 hypothetical protein K7T73_12750 [Bacillus badius]
MNKEIVPHEERCAECRVRRAERLCDYIKEYGWTTAGHPRNFTFTCDLPLCKECAVRVNNHDFCDQHAKLYEIDQRYWRSKEAHRKNAIRNAWYSKMINEGKQYCEVCYEETKDK